MQRAQLFVFKFWNTGTANAADCVVTIDKANTIHKSNENFAMNKPVDEQTFAQCTMHTAESHSHKIINLIRNKKKLAIYSRLDELNQLDRVKP